MYADIDGEQVKYTGLVAECTSRLGKSTDDGPVTLTYREVATVFVTMFNAFSDGSAVKLANWASETDASHNRYVGQHILAIASDAKVMRILFDWVSNHEQEAGDTITFA